MSRLSRRTVLAGGATLLVAPHALAAPPVITGVVELFTSQGCSSCPPADKVIAALAQRDDVVALACHVDYWDYLGWKDTLASPESTQRQYDYAAALGQRSVYTPQAVVNGRRHCNGADAGQIGRWLEEDRAAGRSPVIGVGIELRNDRLHLRVDQAPLGARENVHLKLAMFRSRSEVVIERGENAGRTIAYANAVTGFRTIGMWDGKPMEVDWPASELIAEDANGCAAILQSVTAKGKPGAILGAAILPRRVNG